MRPNDMQIVAVPSENSKLGLPPRPPPPSLQVTNGSSALVEYKAPEEDEDIEIKLRRIIDNVPVRVSNTSGSSAGSGSGDFHQYRQMRRKEQDRLARMDVDYQKRKEVAEFNMRREQKLRESEERTAKKRQKRQKKKQRQKEKKKTKVVNANGEQVNHKEDSDDEKDSDEDGNSDVDEYRVVVQNRS